MNRAASLRRTFLSPVPTICSPPTTEAVDSLPSELADGIEQAAAAEGTTVSAWIADTAAQRVRVDADANTAPSPR